MMTRKEILLDIAERCGIDIDGSEYVMTYNRDKMIKFKRWLFKELKNADKEPCEDKLIQFPEGATNGEMIQITFNCNVIEISKGKVYVEHIFFPFDEEWWNAPYKGVKE